MADQNRPERLPDTTGWITYDPEEGRSELWNRLIRRSGAGWVFFLEDDETVRLSSFPAEDTLEETELTPALIVEERGRNHRQFYQMRLIHRDSARPSSQNIFAGRNLPDSTRYIRDNGISLNSNPIVIERESSFLAHVDIDEELSERDFSPKLYLVQGERYFSEGKYVKAAAQYRQLLKREKLLPFDRLAAVNGLASCFAEQYKWNEAITLSEESLKAESLQRLPYLIQFRIFELQKAWREALEVLKQYHKRLSLYSMASFDRIMDEEQTLVTLANIALKAGEREEATRYFGDLFTYKRGEIEPQLLKKVLLLSIELKDYRQSVHLFERLFSDRLPDQLDAKAEEELTEIMDLFMKGGWHEYVSQVYAQLHEAYPENSTYYRKLIVTLSKTDRLDQARQMVAGIL